MKKLLFLVLPLAFLSCEGDFDKTLPESVGREYELLIVTAGTGNSTSFRRNVMMALYDPLPNMPQAENLLAITFIDQSHFSNLYKRHANVLFLSTNNGNDAAGRAAGNVFSEKNLQNVHEGQMQDILVRRDVWAVPQQVMYAAAPDTVAMLDFFMKNSAQIIKQVEQFEDKRLKSKIYTGRKKTIDVPFKENHSFELDVPTFFELGEQRHGRDSMIQRLPITHYYWLRSTQADVISDFMVYVEPYHSSRQLEPGYILSLRDSISRLLVKGPDGISYMGRQEVPETIDTVSLNGNYAIETRGLWGLFGSGEKMGGPFLNYTVLDTVNNQVITLDGYTWAPGKKKRSYIKRHEVIFSTLKTTDK